MASIRKEISLNTAPGTVWEAIRDFHQVHRRLAYAIVEGRPTHHNASFQVLTADGGGCRIVWTADLLANELAPPSPQ